MALPTRVSRGMTQFDPFEAAQREFDSALGRFLGGRGGDLNGQGGALAPYGVDVREDQDHIYVEAELPGFRKDELDITLENQTLTITAEKNEQRNQGPQGKNGGENKNQGDYLLRERRYTRFARSFTLPPTVDENTCDAKLQDGVLTITLNKREETKPRKVKVS